MKSCWPALKVPSLVKMFWALPCAEGALDEAAIELEATFNDEALAKEDMLEEELEIALMLAAELFGFNEELLVFSEELVELCVFVLTLPIHPVRPTIGNKNK